MERIDELWDRVIVIIARIARFRCAVMEHIDTDLAIVYIPLIDESKCS